MRNGRRTAREGCQPEQQHRVQADTIPVIGPGTRPASRKFTGISPVYAGVNRIRSLYRYGRWGLNWRNAGSRSCRHGTMTTRIQTQAELLALTSRRARRGVLRVELNVPGYSRDVRRLQHHLNRSLNTRGWAMAGLFLGIGFLVFAGFALLLPSVEARALHHVVALVTAFSLLGVSGKLTGLWRADRRLRRALSEYRI